MRVWIATAVMVASLIALLPLLLIILAIVLTPLLARVWWGAETVGLTVNCGNRILGLPVLLMLAMAGAGFACGLWLFIEARKS